MAELKWIKISLSMFDDEKLKLIDAMPERDTIHYVWIRLLVQAGKTNANGFIYLNENIPYTDEMLSTIFNRPLNSIRFALKTLKDFGMIDIDSGNFIKICNWEKHQNVEGMERVREQNRIRQQRKRLKDSSAEPILIRDNFICQYCGDAAIGVDHIIPTTQNGSKTDENNMVACCQRCNQIKMTQKLVNFLNNNLDEGFLDTKLILKNAVLNKLVQFKNGKFISCHVTTCDNNALEVEEEGEIEVEEDITTATTYKPDSDYINFFNTNIHKITQHELQILKSYAEDGLAHEVITLALQEAVEADAKDMRYIRTVLDRWLQHELRTVEAVEADKVKFRGKRRNQQPKPQGKPSTFNNFEQRTYDFKELEKKLLGYED